MSVIWLVFVTLGVGSLILTQQAELLTMLMIESVKDTAVLSGHLLVMMMFWLGFMKIAEAGGLIHLLTRVMKRPLMWLFQSVNRDSQAFSYIASNICFNMLGLGNAATPFGLKAMQLLKHNNQAMTTLVILNTSGLALYPTNLIALRLAFKSEAASAIILPVLLTTLVTTITAIGLLRVTFNTDRRDLSR